MQTQYSIPNVRDKRTKIKRDDRGYYVAVFGARWYAPEGVAPREGYRVLVRFDVPGTNHVSVWTLGDTLLGEFTR